MRMFRIKAHADQKDSALQALQLGGIGESWEEFNPMQLASIVGIERDQIDTVLIEGGGVITFRLPVEYEATPSSRVRVQIDVEINS